MPFRRLTDESPAAQLPVRQEEPVQPPQEQQSWPSYLAGEASRFGAKGLSALLGFPADIGHAILGPQEEMIEKLRQKVPAEGIQTPFAKLTPEKYEGPAPLSSEFYFDKIYKPLVDQGLPENYARAQSKLGEIMDTTAQNLAIGGLLGGGTLKQLGLGAVGGAVGKQAAKELKYGPTGQAVGGLIGGVAAQSIPDLWKARGQLKKLQDAMFGRREEIGKMTWGNAKNLEQELLDQSIYIERHQPFSSTERKEIYDRIETIGRLIAGGKFNLMDAVDQEKALNDMLYNRDFDKPARQFIGKIKSLIRNFINKNGSPEFLKDHKEANSLWLALNGNNLISKALESAADLKKIVLHPLSKILLSGIGLTGGAYLSPAILAKTLGGIAVTYGTRGAYRMASAIVKDPHARELYTKILLDAGSGKLAIASKDAVKHVEQFNKYVSKKTNQFENKNPKRFRRITD